MSLSDSVARFQARLGPNAPTLATTGANTILMQIANAVLADGEDTRSLITAGQSSLFIATAVGTALEAKAADYGITRNRGSAAAATVVFKSQTPLGQSLIIQSGTLVSTVGDNISSIPQVFRTGLVAGAAPIFAAGQTISPVIPVINVAPSAAGNVAQGTITVIMTPLVAGISVSNAVGDGATAGSGGSDSDSDAQLRTQVYATIQPRYGSAAVENAILSVSGVYDAYVPIGGSGGAFTYSYAAPDGTLGGATLQNAVATAVATVLPPSITATAALFTSVVTVTALTYNYSAPTAIAATTIEPLIVLAIQQYIQGVPVLTPLTRSGLIHNQIPTTFGMSQYVQVAIGYALTNFSIGATTPAIAGAALTTLYRLSASAAFTANRT